MIYCLLSLADPIFNHFKSGRPAFRDSGCFLHGLGSCGLYHKLSASLVLGVTWGPPTQATLLHSPHTLGVVTDGVGGVESGVVAILLDQTWSYQLNFSIFGKTSCYFLKCELDLLVPPIHVGEFGYQL